jgi:hypothetical protein
MADALNHENEGERFECEARSPFFSFRNGPVATAQEQTFLMESDRRGLFELPQQADGSNHSRRQLIVHPRRN